MAKYTGRVEGKWESRPPDACQNLILFQTTEFGKVRVILCTLATICFIYSVLDKAGKAKDLERYVVVAINSENKG